MSCRGQGTAGDIPFDLGEAGSGGINFGPIQVEPEPVPFSRTELQALRDRTRDLLARTIIDEARREFMESMVEDLDMLDALEARDEADLASLDETIEEHMGGCGVHVTHRWPPCCDDCPNHNLRGDD